MGLDLDPDVDVDVDPGRELAAFRVVQEALTNVLRHAGPTHVRVRVAGHPHLRVEVTDAGARDDMRTSRMSRGVVPMIKVVLADDQALVRGGFRSILEKQPDIGSRPSSWPTSAGWSVQRGSEASARRSRAARP